jgi:hypothetical protein
MYETKYPARNGRVTLKKGVRATFPKLLALDEEMLL